MLLSLSCLSCLSSLSLGLLSSSSCPEAQGRDLLVKASRIMVTPEKALENSAILIRKGKVAFVGDDIPEDAVKSARKISFEGTLVPGFVNPHCSLGHGANLAERIDSFTPELQASDAFDPFVKDLWQAARQGITSAGLSPSSYNTFAGLAAVVKTGPIGRLFMESSYLKMALVDQALDQKRYPTSRMGAADLIRSTFKRANSALGPLDLRMKVLKEVSTGARKLALHANTQAELTSALDLCKELSLQPILIGCKEAHKCLDRFAEVRASLVLAPLGFGSKNQRLSLPAELEKRGIPFSFMAERPQDLRLSAALALRHGTSRKSCLAALTVVPAEQLAASSRVGTLHQGRDADFCVYGGDPLDLTSKLVATFLEGKQLELEKK